MSVELKDTQSIFTSIAQKYDRLNSLLTLNIDRKWRKKAIQLCQLKANHQVLDLCCGTGKMIELECLAVGKETEVMGLDFNQEMIDVGYQKLGHLLEGYQYNLIKGDAMALPFNENTFDCVTIALGIRNIGDKSKVLSEIYRVLKPGGKVVCLELSKPQIPILKNIFNGYLNHILPIIGYLGTRDKAAYNYLRDSVNGFVSKKELQLEFDQTGFLETGYVSLTGGISSLHYGRK